MRNADTFPYHCPASELPVVLTRLISSLDRWNAEQRVWCCSVSELLALGMDPDARLDIEAIMNIPVGKPAKAV